MPMNPNELRRSQVGELAALLISLFGDGEALRTWLTGWRETTALLEHLPGPAATTSTIANRAAQWLLSSGTQEAALVSLAAEFPGRAEAIKALRGQLAELPARPLAQPSEAENRSSRMTVNNHGTVKTQVNVSGDATFTFND